MKRQRNKLLIYEDPDLLVYSDLIDSDRIVVSFSYFEMEGLDLSEVGPVAFGDGFLQNLDVSIIFILAKANHWWQVPGRDAMSELIAKVCAPYANRIAWGSSMGAYGALSLGNLMGCNKLICICPQTAISDKHLPMAPRWTDAIAKRPILRGQYTRRFG